jgi:chloramphenicol-sensitive protein RarD
LALLGIMQYIAPTLQFTLGIVLYHEPFSPVKLVGFSIIWMALLIYWAEGLLHRQRAAAGSGVTQNG